MNLCDRCKSEPLAAGQLFTKWECNSCGKKDEHHNTETPTICRDCSLDNEYCQRCVGKLEKVQERKG